MEYYEKSPGPLYEAISVENSTIRHNADSYECKVCGTRAQRPSRLADHIKAKHMFVSQYRCDECRIPFVNADGLKRHLNNYHIEISEGSVFYDEDENKNIKCGEYAKNTREENLDRGYQCYIFNWTEIASGKVMDMSVDFTSAVDLTYGAQLIYDMNVTGTEKSRLGLPYIGCSYVSQFLKGWTFNPKEVKKIGHVSVGFSTAVTIKYATRLVTDAACHNKSKNSLRQIEGCQEIFLSSIEASLDEMPQRNKEYFKNRMWLDTNSEENPKKAKFD
ncbi:uncharacterized protein LOC118433370 [Folsomia candida]|nr:uncharacterized protein LOC118433370 [Folsomia candida]